MSTAEAVRSLLADLKEIDCRIWVEDGKLKVRTSKAGITPALKEQLTANKEDILRFLTEPLEHARPGDHESGHSVQLPPLKKSQRSQSFPLSYGQKAFWFLYQNTPESPAYNVAMPWRILSTVNVPILKAVLQALLDRHPSLRSTFSEQKTEQNSQAMQTIHPQQDVCLEELDVSQDTDDELYERVRAAYLRPFDLENGPLFRANLFTQAQDRHVLLITVHHIAFDGWSLWNLMSEFLSLYASMKAGKPAKLAPLDWQYQDFADWQSELFSSTEGERLWEYWKKQLSEQPPILDLPADRPRPSVPSGNGESISFTLPKNLTQQLKTRVQMSGTTLYVMLLASFQVLLHRYSGQNDIWVGSAAAGRSLAEFKDICGCFFNFIVLRGKLEEDQRFSAFIKQVQKTVLDALVHQDYPSLLLIERLQLRRDGDRFPLFQVEFNLQQPQQGHELSPLYSGGDASDEISSAGLTLKPFKMPQQEGQFDLSLDVLDVAGQPLSGIFRYDADLFDKERIQRMLGHLETVLEAVVSEPETRISELPLLTKSEKQQILVEWNNRAGQNSEGPSSQDLLSQDTSFQNLLSQNKCVHELFEEQVASNPDATVLIFENEEVSYLDLNARANRLAHRLRKQGVGPEVLVGLFVERSVDVVAGLLAILKAGGAYVPLDPEYPADRLAFMADDADLKVMLCHGATRDRLPECAAQVLDMTAEAKVIAAESPDNPEVLATPTNLAYIIYTSGSTGKPKGVCVEHRNVVRLFKATEETYGFNRNDVWTLFHSHAFDFSVWEIWGALFYGGTLVVVPYMTTRSPALFYELLVKKGVTVLNQTPSAFYQLIEHETSLSSDTTNDLALRWVIFGGEALTPTRLKPWYERHGDGRTTLVNMYGITETTVHVTLNPLKPSDAEDASSNIGVPIPDLKAYILDKNQEPVPVGIPGELYVGGAGVTRGYLNRSDLTDERFISDPFVSDSSIDDPSSENKSARLYRTGDLCRWLADGSIEYLGRIDTQVKIRGFRIECGEVENALLSHPDVLEAVVDARGEGANKQLVAWLRLAGGALESGALDKQNLGEQNPGKESILDTLRTHLRGSLPDWMIPPRFVFVEALPLTPSGKIDHKALPAPDTLDIANLEYVAPISPTEELLAGLWEAVLEREAIGRFDNFFDLGGHSILATQLASRIRDSFGVELPVRMVFEHSRLSDLAAVIDSTRGSGSSQKLPPIELQPTDASKSLSFAQQRLWFLDRFDTGGTEAYKIPGALRLSGPLDVDALQASLHWMVERHESLRMAFPERDGEAGIVVLSSADFEFPVRDLRNSYHSGSDHSGNVGLEEQQFQQRIDEHVAKPFDLAAGPLFRAEILRLEDEQNDEQKQPVHVLLINMHHIISDGWSLGVFLREWCHAYMAFADGHRPTLAPLPVQYSDYAHWQRQWLQGKILEQQSDYWKETLSGIPEQLALPTDYPRPARLNYRGSHYSQSLPADITTAIKELSQQQGVTLFMTLLAAFNVLLARYSGQDDICVGTPIANRTHTNTENLIGFFVNTLVMRARLNPEQSFRDLLQQVRQTCLGAYAHQDIPFETLVEQLNPTRSLGHSPLFQVMLDFQSDALAEVQWPGLEMTSLEQDYPIAKFDLTLNIKERDGQLHCTWEYATSLFAESTIRRMGEHFEVLLRGILEDFSPEVEGSLPGAAEGSLPGTAEGSLPVAAEGSLPGRAEGSERPISQLPVLTDVERQRILLEWNDTKTPCPKHKCVHELFEEQVANSPGAVALVFEKEEIRYADLNARANRLAHHIRKLGVEPEALVGLCVERSVEMIVAVLAILKAGGAYVPLDPSWPIDRLAFMAEDAELSMLLCHGATRDTLPECAAHILDLDEQAATIAEENSLNPETLAGANTLAYVMYTSGSTGKPKGVCVEHGNIVRLVRNTNYAVLDEHQIFLQAAPISFDAATFELWGSLLNGARLVIPSPGQLSLEELGRYLRQHKVTTLWLTAGLFSLMVDHRPGDLAELTQLLAGGDVLSPEHVAKALRALGNGTLINGYGPTENTTFTACHRIPPDVDPERSIPIGAPISNTRVYILDAHMNSVPVGVSGELYASGAGVARGYLNRPELTEEKFIPDPFSDDPTSRLYKTGDLCRWLPDGNIEFLGRIDTQVKIRGFRIECGEVENALLSHPDIREAVVDARGEGAEKQLLVWIVGMTECSLQRDEIRAHLAALLPEWMVPDRFVFVDALPLTPNGKIDRRALPAPDASEFNASSEYIAPRNPVEQMLADIWRALLGIEKPGIHDNFFDCGGHSLLATRLVSQVRAECGVEIPIRELFEHPSIGAIADYIGVHRQNTKPEETLQEGEEVLRF